MAFAAGAYDAQEQISVTGREVTNMDQTEEKDLLVEAVDLGEIEVLEEVITPATGCGCGGIC